MELKECRKWVARDKEVIAPCQHLSYYDLVVERADGDILTDADGNRYIDFLTSASSLNLGSRNPEVMAAAMEQLGKCTQFTAAYSYNKPMIEYAEELVRLFPGGEAKVCFGNCGSDANDAAVKFCRAYTGRQKIVTFLNSYHGNTYGSSTLSACTARMSDRMGPFLPEVYHFPFFGVDVDDAVCEAECLKEMTAAFGSYLSPKEIAAVIIEPMQGDGGLLPAHPIFMKKLYELCREHGILFIAEEVQQAFFRTGKWFSIQHYADLGVCPDGIIMGKSLGGGFTLGAFMARREIMDCLPAPAHLFTLGGNHLACAAGLASLRIYQTDAFQQTLARNIADMEQGLAALKEKHSGIVSFTRGLGMSCGIGIVKKDANGQTVPDLEGSFKIVYRAYELGLIVITVAGNVLRIQPPVNIAQENLRRGFEILDQAMTELESGSIPDDVLAFRAGW